MSPYAPIRSSCSLSRLTYIHARGTRSEKKTERKKKRDMDAICGLHIAAIAWGRCLFLGHFSSNLSTVAFALPALVSRAPF